VKLHFTEVEYELEMVQHGIIITRNLDSMISEKRLTMFNLRKNGVKVKSKTYYRYSDNAKKSE